MDEKKVLGLFCMALFAASTGITARERFLHEIKEGVLTYSAGNYLAGEALKVGYDIFGYNYLLVPPSWADGSTLGRRLIVDSPRDMMVDPTAPLPWSSLVFSFIWPLPLSLNLRVAS